MTPKRIKNVAFFLLIMACFTAYGAAKTRPVPTTKLVVALIFAASGYGLINWASRVEGRK
jgi:hypothetical protein